MPPLDNFSPRVSPTRFDYAQREGRKPYRTFRSRQYQSLEDDHDDLQSFSSMRLAKDMDKPTKKLLGTWKKKNPVRLTQSSSQPYFSSIGFSSLEDSSFDHDNVPRDVTTAVDNTQKSPDSVAVTNFFSNGSIKDDVWPPATMESGPPKENRHPGNLFQNDKSNKATLRPALRSLNSGHGQSVEDVDVGGAEDQLQVALQLVRLKKELRKMKHESVSKKGDEDAAMESTTRGKKSVRFSAPLVTGVTERPFTEEEDMEKLYFVYGELEELEWDRSTVENDQFECIYLKEEHCAFIEVEHTSRKLHWLGTEGLPHSMSDLSFY